MERQDRILIRETSTSNSEDTSEGSAEGGCVTELICDNKSLIQAKRLYEIDEVYKRIGCRAQVLYALLLAVFGEMFCPFGTLSPVFQTLVPPWECNSTLCNVSDQCASPRDSWYWLNTHRSLISEFELQCNPSYALLASALFWIPGMALGLPLGGYLCDKYGRKRTNIVFMMFSALFGAGMGFAATFEMYLVFQAFTGLALGGSMTTRIIWILEFFPDSRRPIISAVTVQLFCLGSVLLPVADYYLQDWRSLDWIICICAAICVPVMLIIPESPHWLLTNERKDEAESVLTNMAISNNKGCCTTFSNRRPSFDINNIKLIPVKKHNESGNVLTILRDPKLLVMLLGLLYQWFLASLLYYGFYFMTGSLSGSAHWNFAIMGSMEGPCLLVTGLILTKVGRRTMLIFSLVMVALFCCLCTIDYDLGGDWNLRRIFAVIGSKMGSGPVFFIVYIHAAELMPTSLRTTGMNLCSLSARIGSFIAPYLVRYTTDIQIYLPFVIFAMLCGVGVIIALFLPETKGKNFKQTFKK